MNAPKFIVRAWRRWVIPISPFVAFFFAAFLVIPFVVWAMHRFTSGLQEWSPVSNLEIPPLALGVHGYALMAIAALGFPFVLWRGIELQNQSRAASKQSDIAQRNLLNERYQKGVEMLGSPALSVRLGGIYALESLAEHEPHTYYIQIMSVLSAFARNWHLEKRQEDPQDDGSHHSERRVPLEDARAILAIIGSRNSEQCEIESQRKYMIDLMGVRLHYWVYDVRDPAALVNFSNVIFSLADLTKTSIHSAVTFANSFFLGANLAGAAFVKADFSNAYLDDADLSDATFMKANFSNAHLKGADLSGTLLSWANLSGANLQGAKLFGTNLTGVTGPTQGQINTAEIDLQRPPVLEDAVDAITGEPLFVPLPQSEL